MRTRVMQDEPDEPVVHEPPANPPSMGRTNLASRIARRVRSAVRRRSSIGSRS
jgi:hypothetical protein